MTIMINGKLLTSTTDFYQEDVNSIIVISGYGTIVPRDISKVLAEGLYHATQKCTGVITFNGTIIPKDEINEPIFG